MRIKKLLLAFIFFITISFYSHARPVKINFTIEGEGTDNFVVCLADKCDYGSVTTITDGYRSLVPFYINQLISYVRDKEIVKEKMVYKDIIWDKSCNTFHPVCHKKSNNAFSDTLCYTLPLKLINVGAFITAKSKVRDSKLILYSCVTTAY